MMMLELLLEELQRNTTVDLSSELRRNVYELIESNIYVKLLSELDMLESKKKKKGEKFWNKQKDAENYTHYLRVKEKMDEIAKEIESYEMELSLSIMDLKPYRPAILDEVKAWEKKYEDMKIELYSRLNPEYNTCHIALMGADPIRLYDFYSPILKARGLEIETAKTLWYRESYYNEIIPVKKTETIDGQIFTKQSKEQRKDYLQTPILFEEKNPFKGAKAKDTLCGIILTVKSPAIFLYFEKEGGRTDWIISKKEEYRYLVQSSTAEPDYPRDIHRKDFFNKNLQKPRRIINPFKLKDTEYKINRDIQKDNHHEFIQKHLDKLFRKRLDEEISGGDFS